MEGEEKGKRKPLTLDWEKLLRSSDMDDGEPPLLVVEKPAKKPKLVEIHGGDDEDEDDSARERIRSFSDKELEETIARMKRNIPVAQRTSDGGAKFLLSIKCHETELERRRRQKDDEKCKQPAQFHDLSCLGADDDTQEKPLQGNNGSKFGPSFLSKMEKQTQNVFQKELSMLNRSDHQTKRFNEHHASMGRHNGGLSSKQKPPLQSPTNLSRNGANYTLLKDDQKIRCSMTTSPHHSKDVLASQMLNKSNSSQVQPSYDRRRNNTVVLVDEDDTEIAEMTQEVDQLDECIKEARISYPERDDPESVEIRYSDLECLAPEAYLTSAIINFYIRYLQQNKYSTSKQEEAYHFFNTYFYEKLKKAVLKKNDPETSFTKIRRWWKGVKLFEKAYIFLPIHEQFHWSLVIICIPDKADGTGPIVLHLDSLKLHPSKLIFENIRRFLIGEWEFLKKEEALPDLPFPNHIWEHFPRRIQEKAIEVPQQRNEYDCGLFVLFFIERFIERAPDRLKREDLATLGREWFRPVRAYDLRETIRRLLIGEFKKARENDCLLDPFPGEEGEEGDHSLHPLT